MSSSLDTSQALTLVIRNVAPSIIGAIRFNPFLPGIVPIGTQKKHLVSDWSIEDLEASDWLKFLIFVKYFFSKTLG